MQPGPDVAEDRFARGAALAATGAAWLVPAVLPAALLQSALVALPWMDSAEARSEEASVSWAADRQVRDTILEALQSMGGPRLALLVVLATVAWIAVLRFAGPFRRGALAPRPSRSHVLHALELGAWMLGAAGCLLVRRTAQPLEQLVDVVTSLRPSGAASLALLLASQAFTLAACAAILGAALELARMARHPRARLGALAVLVALAAGAAASQVGARHGLTARFDVGRRLEDALGRTDEPGRVHLGILARDRTWMLPVRDGLGGVRYSPEGAARADRLLAARRSWSLLAADAERYLVGERLFALDPDGARDAALRSVLRHGSMSHALLVSLGSAAPGPDASRVLATMESSPSLVFGRDALYLAAHAHARLGDAGGARDALARLKSRDGMAWVRQRHDARPLVLTTATRGSITGRILVDGEPWRGRIALVSTRDVFSFPAHGGDLPVTWLLRLVTATSCAADGSFAFAGLPDDEMALVLMLPAPLSPRRAPLPPIVISPESPSVELGDVELATSG